MPEAARKYDICTGHGCYPPRPNDEASDNVRVNSRGWHRAEPEGDGDHWIEHCCGSSPRRCHESETAKGSSTVFVNLQQAARIGDPVKCGSAIATGSPNVFAGG